MARVWIGIGCQRGIKAAEIEEAIASILTNFEAIEPEIIGMATIDTKADEIGLIEYCQQQNLCLVFYSAALLAQTIVPHPSDRVAKAIGTPSVAEAAALLAANRDRLIIPKQNYRCASGRSISIALSRSVV